MPFFPKELLAEIRNRADIVDVISDYVTLKKVGRNYQALCPFHTETAPSFIVSKEKQVFHCFGCQKGGDVISFVKEINTISFAEASKLLADKYGISIPRSRERETHENQKETLFAVNQKAAAFFHHILVDRPEGEIGRAYLQKRGISESLWRTFTLGYAPDSWHALSTFLASRKLSLELAQSIGLVSSKTEGRFFDCFRGRIMFPIFDQGGNIIGFGGRAITGGTPKYINSPDSLIYRKSYSLFGIPITRDSIRSEDRVFIVEGYFDLITLYQSGIEPVVAPLGTSLTTGHIQTLRRYTSNFFVVFDADEAGGKAALRSLELFLAEGLFPKVVLLPPGTDPDEMVRTFGSNAFRKKVETAPLLLDYYLEEAIKHSDLSSSAGKLTVLTTVIPVISGIAEPITQDDYLRRLAERLDVREDRVRTFIKGPSTGKPGPSAGGLEEDRREEFLLSFMLQKPEIIRIVHEVRVIEDFENTVFRKIGMALIETFMRDGVLEVARLLDTFDDTTRAVVTMLSIREVNFGDIISSLRDCICQVKRNKIRKMQIQLTHKIKKAQEDGNEAGIRDLHRQKMQLLKQQKNLVTAISSLVNA